MLLICFRRLKARGARVIARQLQPLWGSESDHKHRPTAMKHFFAPSNIKPRAVCRRCRSARPTRAWETFDYGCIDSHSRGLAFALRMDRKR